MITDQQRKESILLASNTIKDMYGSMVLAGIIKSYESIVKKDRQGVLVDIIGDTILGFHKTSELPSLLQKEVGVSADIAQRILSDFTEFLGPVLEREAQEENAKRTELASLQATFTPVATGLEAPTKLKEDVTPIEHDTVQPMRTMEGDMGRIRGYGAYRAQFPDTAAEAAHTEQVMRTASQEELLTEKPKLAQMPGYSEEDTK